uniref:Uncharacterized protein n=1 Tax=Cannabis sativa TaxID=3483 RepID=A0A803PIK8_CANSA
MASTGRGMPTLEEQCASIQLKEEDSEILVYGREITTESPIVSSGILGHGERYCKKFFDNPVELVENPYGAWMRVNPHHRNHTIGAKWPKTVHDFSGVDFNSAAAQGGALARSGEVVTRQVTSVLMITETDMSNSIVGGGTVIHDAGLTTAGKDKNVGDPPIN